MPYGKSLVLSALLILSFGQGFGLDEIAIQEWKVPWEGTRPRDPYMDGEGRVWFVGQKGHYTAYLDVASGQFKRFDLAPGTGPHTLIVDEGGDVWYAGNLAAHIGRLDPGTGEIAKYPMPHPDARDPHTMAFNREGDIWFSVQKGNFVGKMSTQNPRDVHLIPVPTPRARPYGIVVDSTNRPWVALLGTNKIATVDPTSMKLKEHTLPFEDARPRRLQVTSDHQVWYVDYARGSLGRLNPSTGQVSEWQTPGGSDSHPYAMEVDTQDRLWFVETGVQPNRFVGFDPGTNQFFSITEIGSGGGTVRNMMYHPPTNSIWFGTDTNYVGRAQLP